MTSLIILISFGFFKSYQEQSQKWGKKFKFWTFFFGIENNKNPSTQCNKATFKKYETEIDDVTKKRSNVPITFVSILPELMLIGFIILITTLLPRLIDNIKPLLQVQGKEKIKTEKSWKSVVE